MKKVVARVVPLGLIHGFLNPAPGIEVEQDLLNPTVYTLIKQVLPAALVLVAVLLLVTFVPFVPGMYMP